VPATVNCKVGDTVNWTNPGVISHSVTFDPAQAATKENVVLPAGVAAFDSGTMEEGATFSHTFTRRALTSMSANSTKPWA